MFKLVVMASIILVIAFGEQINYPMSITNFEKLVPKNPYQTTNFTREIKQHGITCADYLNATMSKYLQRVDQPTASKITLGQVTDEVVNKKILEFMRECTNRAKVGAVQYVITEITKQGNAFAVEQLMIQKVVLQTITPVDPSGYWNTMLQLCKENEQLVRNEYEKEVKILRQKINELEEEYKKMNVCCMKRKRERELACTPKNSIIIDAMPQKP